MADSITSEAFDRGLLLETAGPADEVVKLLPPLVVSDAEIDSALSIISESAQATVDRLGDELQNVEVDA